MSDFTQFKAINSKLKKRFLLRKPNFSEASQQFSDLSQDCKEFKLFAGHCCLASARCEHSLGNTNMELQALLQGARYFAEGKEMNAAISAYRHALLISAEAALPYIYTELARLYEKHRRFNEAAIVYEEATMYREAANCYMDGHLYDKALTCFNKLDKQKLKVNDEISIFLLKLFLYDVRRLSLEFPVVNYTCEDDDIISLNILLESLFYFETEHGEGVEIKSNIIAKLNPFLDGRQKELLSLGDPKTESNEISNGLFNLRI
ncbi:40-kDa huntingtin-associated protein-like [Panonychus citri]|uniref:40-kDa huntingtin-associated protein-like n=1 Tax=Panonychus citri TaxID=50023 RepID=UPI0023077AF0|nr:40-kDa huntingtin-associated protein-like [Panonychus citri]